MGHHTAVVLPGCGHQVFDDQRPAQCRHQRVAVHVEGIGLDGRQAVLVRELVAGVDDDGLDGTAVDGTLAHHLHILAALSEVDGDSHHLTAGLLADPADGHRGVQAAGIGQDDALGHEVSPLGQCLTDVLEHGGQLRAGHRLARDHQNGVIPGDGADHLG